MKLLLFFIDGLGLGNNDKSNPARKFLDGIADIPFVKNSAPVDFPEGMLLAADATGGIPGLPQSATGQTMMLCGFNAPAFLGYHLTALPNEALVNLIGEKNILRLLVERAVKATASNLYSPEYFSRRESLEKKRGRNTFPVSALSIRSSHTAFRFLSDYHEGRALFADLTNRSLRERGYDIPLIEPEEAADLMVNILKESDFVFHEYFVTDTYAHKKRRGDLERALKELNKFLISLREKTDPEETAILVVSDHGNCEDADTADHTRNPVPVLLLSRNEAARNAFRGVTRLEEVQAGMLAYFGLPAEDEILESGSTWL
ncbi:MAG: alkaline phosphatase family protein [Spirochaetaceae bacterium]|nr:alkaline phosphatase family protein [Spirochaetaceae bacterium]